MTTTITQDQVIDLARRARYAGGDWRANMPATEALDLACGDISRLGVYARAYMDECDCMEDAVVSAIKGLMEHEADWFDSTGFNVVIVAR